MHNEHEDKDEGVSLEDLDQARAAEQDLIPTVIPARRLKTEHSTEADSELSGEMVTERPLHSQERLKEGVPTPREAVGETGSSRRK